MATATAQKKQQEKQDQPLMFEAPLVCIGEPGIIWYPQADRKNTPAPAVVQEVFRGVLTLEVHPSKQIAYSRSGVRHIDDPFFKTCDPSVKTQGAWDYCESLRSRHPSKMVPKPLPKPDANAVDEAAEAAQQKA
jgi:hypothetical protein